MPAITFHWTLTNGTNTRMRIDATEVVDVWLEPGESRSQMTEADRSCFISAFMTSNDTEKPIVGEIICKIENRGREIVDVKNESATVRPPIEYLDGGVTATFSGTATSFFSSEEASSKRIVLKIGEEVVEAKANIAEEVNRIFAHAARMKRLYKQDLLLPPDQLDALREKCAMIGKAVPVNIKAVS